jgi:hypothetical protein
MEFSRVAARVGLRAIWGYGDVAFRLVRPIG